jgi:hypothetical protein
MRRFSWPVQLSGFGADWRKLHVYRTDRVLGSAMKNTEDVKIGGSTNPLLFLLLFSSASSLAFTGVAVFKRRGVLGKKQAVDADEFDILFPDFSDLNSRCLLLAAAVCIAKTLLFSLSLSSLSFSSFVP